MDIGRKIRDLLPYIDSFSTYTTGIEAYVVKKDFYAEIPADDHCSEYVDNGTTFRRHKKLYDGILYRFVEVVA